MIKSGNMAIYHVLAVKMAEGLGYLNSREQGFIRLEKSSAVALSGYSRGIGAVTGLSPAGERQGALEVNAAANRKGEVKVVTCHNCRGRIGWRLDIGLEGNCPYCGTLLQV